MTADERAYAKVLLEEADVSDQVWSIDVEDCDRGSDKATLVMDDPDSTNADPLREGLVVLIELGWESERAPVFEGLVTRVEPSITSGSRRVTLVAYDLSTKLQARRAPGRLHAGTLKEILTAIVEPAGIAMGSVTIEPLPKISEDAPLPQGDRTDWELIQDLAEQYRARAFVEINVTTSDSEVVRERGGKSRFYFVSEEALLAQEPMGRLFFCRGRGQLIEFDYKRVGGGASPSASATVADPDTGEPVDHPAEPVAVEPPLIADTKRASRTASVLGTSRAQAYTKAHDVTSAAAVQPDQMRATDHVAGGASDPAAKQRTIKQDRTRVLGFAGEGVAMGTVFMRAKGAVKIEGLATWAAGNWYVTRVNHVVQRTKVKDKTQLTYRIKFRATR